MHSTHDETVDFHNNPYITDAKHPNYFTAIVKIMTTDILTLELKECSLVRGGRMVLTDLDFSLRSGQLLILHGANGSGKTSLMRALAGFIPFHTGRLYWQGDDVTRDREILEDHLSYLGHQNGLKPALTLRENLHTIATVQLGYTLDNHQIETATKTLAMDRLLDEPVRYFSSGQQRRGALCLFPLLKKKLWIMDEPTVGLDTDNKQRLGQLMQDHLSAKGMIIASTHETLGLDGTVLDLADFTPKPCADTSLQADLEGWV